jgi:hypothetical protein
MVCNISQVLACHEQLALNVDKKQLHVCMCVSYSIHQVHNQFVHCSVLKRFPRSFETYIRDTRQPDMGYLYFAKSDEEPDQHAVKQQFISYHNL